MHGICINTNKYIGLIETYKTSSSWVSHECFTSRSRVDSGCTRRVISFIHLFTYLISCWEHGESVSCLWEGIIGVDTDGSAAGWALWNRKNRFDLLAWTFGSLAEFWIFTVFRPSIICWVTMLAHCLTVVWHSDSDSRRLERSLVHWNGENVSLGFPLLHLSDDVWELRPIQSASRHSRWGILFRGDLIIIIIIISCSI